MLITVLWTHSWKEHVVDLRRITAAMQRKLKIKVEDWDRFSANDFMGKINLPVCALVSAGPGTHEFWVPLARSAKHASAGVSGEICIRATVAEL